MLLKRILYFSFSCAMMACNGQEQGERRQEAPGENPVVQQEQALPQTRQDTLMIEGMAEPVELQLYQAPEGWPIPFYTYLPAGMETETISSGEGDAIRFNFNEATVHVFTFPEGTSRAEAQPLAMEALGTEAVQACDNEWEWQWGCYYASDKEGKVSRILMGEREGRYFYFLIQYPGEYGDGFAPRYNLLLNEWAWRE